MLLDEPRKQLLLSGLAGVSDGDHLCHGNFHPICPKIRSHRSRDRHPVRDGRGAGQAFGVLRAASASAVAQHSMAATPIDRSAEPTFTFSSRALHSRRCAPAAGLIQLRHRAVEPLLVVVDRNDDAAVLRDDVGGGSADAARRRGDQRHLVVKAASFPLSPAVLHRHAAATAARERWTMQLRIPKRGPQWRAASGHRQFSGCGVRDDGPPPSGGSPGRPERRGCGRVRPFVRPLLNPKIRTWAITPSPATCNGGWCPIPVIAGRHPGPAQVGKVRAVAQWR